MISVITCVYNQRADFVRDCARSVAAQEKPLEWIIVDDGSAAEFTTIYARVLSEFPSLTLKIIRLNENRGLSYARNTGLKEAKGDWIVILDSDDQLTAKTANILNCLDDEAAFVCFAVQYLKVDGGVEVRRVRTWERLFRKHALTPRDPFLWFDFYYHGMIARRWVFEQIGGYNSEMKVGEDQDVLLRACELLKAKGIFFIDEFGYRYRQNPSGICATRWEEVELNYTATMVAGARRRGAQFSDCRFARRRLIENALIEEYEYCDADTWLRWDQIAPNDSL